MRKLVAAADLTREDAVLEVGTGTGALTELLSAGAGWVMSVEIDRALFGIASERLADRPNVELIHCDVLDSKNRLSTPVDDGLDRLRANHPRRLLLVANLPYSVTTPMIMISLLDRRNIDCICCTVQREAADRITADPGTKAYGPISIVTQATCRVSRLAVLAPTVFWPRPKVESAMLRIDRTESPFQSPDELTAFATWIRGAFVHRRKSLKHNLVAADRLQLSEFDLSRRPEQVAIEEWIRWFKQMAAAER